MEAALFGRQEQSRDNVLVDQQIMSTTCLDRKGVVTDVMQHGVVHKQRCMLKQFYRWPCERTTDVESIERTRCVKPNVSII